VKIASSAAIFAQRSRDRLRVHGRLFSDVIYVDVQPAERLFVFAKHRIKERSI
jgi:hypothetical protein